MSQMKYRQTELKASRESDHLPQISNNYTKSNMNRLSLKKLNQSTKQHINHHLQQLPKLVAKKKQTQQSLLQKLDRTKAPKLVHRRQKLHTQGMLVGRDSFSSIDQSFVSLNNQLSTDTNQQEQQFLLNANGSLKADDNTMMNFRKNIEQNKQYIKQEIQKKNKENQQKIQSRGSPNGVFMKKKRVNSSKILESHSPSAKSQKKTLETPVKKKNYNRRSKQPKKSFPNQQSNKKSLSKTNEKILLKRQSQVLFSNLQVMLDQKAASEKDKKKSQQKKLKDLLDKLQKFQKDKSYSSSNYLNEKELVAANQQLNESPSQIHTAVRLKGETNYNDWNKLNISSTSEISYRRSSFEDELHKINELTDRNQASLQKYLQTRKQLLKYGFQVFSSKKSA